MTEELKPCPFCGCNLNDKSNVFKTVEYIHGSGQYIQCPWCGIRTRAVYDEYELIHIWNERVGE